MAGIIILSVLLIVFVVVFVLYCVLIYLPVRWAKKRGITGRKRFYIGVASFIIVSALFFGKNLVSYTAFKYYCKNEAGLTVYKTLDQWKAENPGVWETLRKVNGFRDYEDREKYADVALERDFDGKKYGISYGGGNQRIISYSRAEYPFWGAVRTRAYIIWDNEAQEILAKYQYFHWKNTWGTSPDKDGWRGRSYLGNEICDPEDEEFFGYGRSFSNFNLKREEKRDEQ